MAAAESLNDDSFAELFKLEKLFEAKFSLRPTGEPAVERPDASVTLSEAHRHDCVTMDILLRPTDPEFQLSLLGGDPGLRMKLTLHRMTVSGGCVSPLPSQGSGPPASAASSSGRDAASNTGCAVQPLGACYTLQESRDIEIANSSISNDVKLVIKKVMLAFLAKYRPVQRYAVYESLKFLERELCRIFQLRSSRCPPSSQADADHEVAWSLQEQKSLEFALSKTKGLSDPAKRWEAVSSVVKTKTADQCRRRFQRCREQLLSRASEEKKAVTTMPAEYQTVLSRSEPLRLVELELVKVSVFNVVSVVAQLVCIRCDVAFDASLHPGDKKSVVLSRSCEHCHVSHRCEFQPQIAFVSQSTIGNLSLENCVFRDLISAEFYLTCEDCDTQCKVRDVLNGARKNTQCRGCFAKLVLGFRCAEFGAAAPPSPVASAKPRHVPPRVDRKRPSGCRGLKVGTPLPDNGACKHYRKSFRWFRFPCCGKLFPCDSCHDEASDHPYEHAHMVVCGHCSTHQAVSNKKCCHCERGYTASTSSYWEGGKGCRDATRLSRRDSKKYRLLRRQTEQAQGESRDKPCASGRPRRT